MYNTCVYLYYAIRLDTRLDQKERDEKFTETFTER